MVIAALVSRSLSLSQWHCHLPLDVQAASIERRFSRWLHNSLIDPHRLYESFFRHALRHWTQHPIRLALDTSLLRDNLWGIRISMIYMGRALPVTWRVIEHKSSSVAFSLYEDLLEQAHCLMPQNVPVIFLADRGFVNRQLMRKVSQFGWEWRIRIKSNQVLQWNGRRITPQTLCLQRGNAMLLNGSIDFGLELRNLSFSAGWARGEKEPWFVLSNTAAGVEIFADYALRFDIEEEFRDEKSGGFRIGESRLRDTGALERMMLVVAVASIAAVSEGLCVQSANARRTVDAHWERGLSIFQIGWRWILKQLSQAMKKFTGSFELRPINNPLPVAPTRKESIRRRKSKNPKRLFRSINNCATLP